jgi:hypothetical protein
MNITLATDNVVITPSTSRRVDVEMNDIEASDLLDYVTIEQVLNHFNTSEILDGIGIEEVKNYFNLIEE